MILYYGFNISYLTVTYFHILNILNTLRENCPYSELFWSVFSHIRTVYGEMLRMRENTDQNNSEYGHFLRSDCAGKSMNLVWTHSPLFPLFSSMAVRECCIAKYLGNPVLILCSCRKSAIHLKHRGLYFSFLKGQINSLLVSLFIKRVVDSLKSFLANVIK